VIYPIDVARLLCGRAPGRRLARTRPASGGAVLQNAGSCLVTEFDRPAEHHDETRRREQRGDGYSADVDAQLRPERGPIVEIGVDTGVVALGFHSLPTSPTNQSRPATAAQCRARQLTATQDVAPWTCGN
jgi:hypothetical protein